MHRSPVPPSSTGPTGRANRAIHALQLLQNPQIALAVLGLILLTYANIKEAQWRWRHFFDWWYRT